MPYEGNTSVAVNLQMQWEVVLNHVNRLVDDGIWKVAERREKPHSSGLRSVATCMNMALFLHLEGLVHTTAWLVPLIYSLEKVLRGLLIG